MLAGREVPAGIAERLLARERATELRPVPRPKDEDGPVVHLRAIRAGRQHSRRKRSVRGGRRRLSAIVYATVADHTFSNAQRQF